MKFLYPLLSGLITLLLIVTSCTENDNGVIPIVDNTNNGFLTKQVAEIFADNCATSGCHSGNNASSGLSLDNWTDLLKGSSDRSHGVVPNYGGEVIIPGDIDHSLLYQMITGNVTTVVSAHNNVSLDSSQVAAIGDWILGGALGYNNAVPFSNPSYRVYICDQNSDEVSVIDGNSKVVSAIIDVDKVPLLLDSPHMTKIQNGFIYVTLIGNGNFLKIDISNPAAYEIVGETGANTIEKAGMIMLHPDGVKAYVSRSSTSQPIYQSIYVVNIQSMTIIKQINLPAPGVPHGIALTPDGTKLYVANLSLDRVSIINAVLDEYVDDIRLPGGTEPMQTTISPDGNYLYVSARGSGKLLVYDVNTDTLITEVPVNAMPMHIACTSDGNKIYIGTMMMHTVEVIQKSGMTWTKIKSISHPGFRMIHGCDITSDDRYVYVSCQNTDPADQFKPYYEVNGENPPGFVGIIDTHTDEVVKFLEVEQYGSGLVVEKIP